MNNKNGLGCIFCTTPYQIMTAININETLACDFDIYIVNQFAHSKEIADRLAETKFFNDVLFVDANALGLEYTSKKGMNSLNYKFWSFYLYSKNSLSLDKTVKKYFKTDADYKSIFVSNNAMAGRFASIYLFKHSDSVEFVHYDDGNGSYFDLKSVYGIPLYDRICRTILFGKQTAEIPFSKMLYFPELYKELNGEEKYMQKIRVSKEANDVLSYVFSLSDLKSIAEPVIIIDTNRTEEFDDTGSEEYSSILSHCEDIVGIKKVIYKKHPRDTSQLVENVMNDDGIPFELFCYKNDFSDRILISSKSTAVFSPKLFFDSEPYIILLYKIMEQHTKTVMNVDPYVHYVKNLYREPERIIVPKDKEQLYKALSELSRKL